jgi:hypothetical protein
MDQRVFRYSHIEYIALAQRVLLWFNHICEIGQPIGMFQVKGMKHGV